MRVKSNLSRREFLKVSGIVGGGMLISICLPGCGGSPTATPEPTATLEPTVLLPTATAEPTTSPTNTPETSSQFEPNVYIKIDKEGTVTITVHRSEMGQGVRTALPMIVAEELDVDWSAVRVEQAPADPAYGDQTTGGSRSISAYYSALRKAGATARQMLITAAAQKWGTEQESCYTENGWVLHRDSERRLAYGALVETAATLPAPEPKDVTLKDPKDFRIIGTRIGHWDAPQMLDGSAVYGIDVKVPNMLYATIARSPVFGGEVVGFDATKAKAVVGVRDVVQVDNGIAVVADSTWAAIQGRKALEITWDEGEHADLSSADIRQLVVKRAPQPGEAADSDATKLDAAYDIPYLAHATMEPMNCVADVRADSCEVWAPTQNPQEAKRRAVSASGLPADAVKVNITLIGGGFGRRLGVDYVTEAVQVSKAVGAPVQVMWTREDDIQHDLYHPLSYNYVSAKLDGPGRPVVRSYPAQYPIPTGYWRAVTNVQEAFAHECFLDELAAASGRDPYELRFELLPERARAVLELVATKAGWGTPLPDGWGRGIAYHATWDTTHVAQVAEVSVAGDGAIQVHRVVCAVDCGIVVNPDVVEAQMESGIVFGLTATLKEGITIENGRVQQSNFHDYPILRFDEMPTIEVYIVPSEERPQGIGEMGNPPIAPAVANAVFAATGKRIRRLPIRPEDLREA